ncbi:S1 RNA-binding domain-containing protein [Haploplasma modicum]|uniref:S1 RNA-binding domain-containing protein n=1 Tax=Haploplasma modicum TaxID=2150 RepID=UPI00047E9D22|nr:S1 RNA-binding domain-containing protein [Haploplasma modicum]
MDMKDVNLLKVGQIVEGEVIKVTDNTIYLDVKSLTEAKMHLDNYDKSLESFIGVVKVGDKVTGKVQKVNYDEPVMILISRLPLIKLENFEKIEKLVETKEIVKAKVKKIEEKGLILNYLDYEVFLPYTLLDYDLIENKKDLKNKVLEINIIEASRNGRFTRIVGSRKEIFEAAKKEAFEAKMQERKEQLESVQTGNVLTGVIEKIDKHAAYVRFDSIIGLLRISQVSHHRIEKLDEVLKIGQEVTVKVIKKEGNRLDLSMKALLPTPFAAYLADKKIGDEVTGHVFQKLPFGMIIELAEDVRGLLHRNDYSWDPSFNLDTQTNINDEITLKIVNMDVKKERIALSRKAIEENPWRNVTVKRGDITSAKVLEVSNKELTVEVEGVKGTILAKDAILGQGSLESFFSKGDMIDEAIVIEANPKTWELKLSIVRVLEKKERESFEQYLENDSDEGTQTIGDLFGDQLKK